MGTYGAQGYDVIDGPSSLPSYASVTPSGALELRLGRLDHRPPRPADLRRLPAGSPPAGTRRPASRSTSNLTDGQPHDLELYLLDWDRPGRSEQVQISDASTGAVLSTQSVSSFHSGVYLDYAVSGDIVITITTQGGPNAVLSGLFLDPPGDADDHLAVAGGDRLRDGAVVDAARRDGERAGDLHLHAGRRHGPGGRH